MKNEDWAEFQKDLANFTAALEILFDIPPVLPPTKEEWKELLLWVAEAHMMRDKYLYRQLSGEREHAYWQKELESRSRLVYRKGYAAEMHKGKIKWDMRLARRAIEGDWVETFEPTLERFNPKQIEWFKKKFG